MGATALDVPVLLQQVSEKLKPVTPAAGQGPVQAGMWRH